MTLFFKLSRLELHCMGLLFMELIVALCFATNSVGLIAMHCFDFHGADQMRDVAANQCLE
jgi:hypothetical protein